MEEVSLSAIAAMSAMASSLCFPLATATTMPSKIVATRAQPHLPPPASKLRPWHGFVACFHFYFRFGTGGWIRLHHFEAAAATSTPCSISSS
jgi:hypothetical protein